MTDLDIARELAKAHRRIAQNNEMLAGAMLAAVRILARDVISLADISPSDPLRPKIVSGARARAAKVLRGLGDDEHAH